MKILKHGNKYFKNKIAICPLCGCEFEYNNNDTEIEKVFVLHHFHTHIKLMLNVLNVIRQYVWVQKLLIRRCFK